ncbi:MAG: ATP-binding protein, partial [Bradymonadaceae bacterium]
VFEAAVVTNESVPKEESEEPEEIVALKKCSRFYPLDIHDFQRHFEALCRLDHGGLAKYRELVVDEDHLYLVRDFVPGMNLATYLNRSPTEEELVERALDREDDDAPSDGDDPRPSALDLVFQRLDRLLPGLLGAIEYLHRFRKIHGNLKPSNIVVDEHGRCHLVDYGLIPSFVPDDDVRPTHSYLAPELRKSWEATAATDLFALGAILYEAISGRPFELLAAHDTDADTHDVFLSEIAPGCPASWVELIHGLLQPQPDRRPGLEELRRVLEAAEAHSVELPPSILDEQDEFLGRLDVLEPLIERAKGCAQERQMALALIEGATGVGKSAIVDALAQWASQRGWLVLRGKCYNRESVAFQGWDEVITQLAHLIDQLPEKIRQKLAPTRELASALFPVLGRSPESDRDGGDRAEATSQARRVAVDALGRLIAEVANQRPILISLDDVHLASSDTSELLTDFFGTPDGTRCLFVATWRPEIKRSIEDHLLWRGLKSAPLAVDRIKLEGFTKNEAREYVLSVASHLPLEQKQEVLRQGAFHPLLLQELIYDVQQEDARSSGPHRALGVKSADETSELPVKKKSTSSCGHSLVDERLSTILRQRIAHLSRGERLVLQLLAVASGPLSAQLLGKVISAELGSQVATVGAGQEIGERLVALRLAKRARGHEIMQPQLPRYVVLHDVGRALVLDDLGRDHHAHLCNAIADAIPADEPDRADLRFEYLLRGGKTSEAALCGEQAALRAQRRFAFHRAAKLWRWILEHPDARDAAMGRRALVHLAGSEYLAGHFDEAARLYESLIDESCASTERARFKFSEARAWLCAGDAPKTIDALDDALSSYGETLRRGPVFKGLMSWRYRVGNALSWANILEDARGESAGEEELLLSDIYSFILDAHLFLDGISRLPVEARHMRIARHTLDTRIILDAYFKSSSLHRVSLIQSQRIWPEVLHKQIHALLERNPDGDGKATHAMLEGVVHHQAGRLDEANASLARAREELSRVSGRDERVALRLIHAQARLAMDWGHCPRARDLAMSLLHLGRGDAVVTAQGHAILVEIDLLCGALDSAEHNLHAAREAMNGEDASLWSVWLVRAAAYWNIGQGRPEVAVAQIDLWMDKWHDQGLLRNHDVDLAITLTLGHGLAALAEAQRLLGQPRQSETHRRLKGCIARLRKAQRRLKAPARAALFRLMARFEMIRGRPQKALRHATSAIAALENHPFPIDAAKCAEVRALVLLRLEKTEARQALEQARALYTHLGCHLPLILEGWPIPRAYSRLHEDE